jgi:hypothetical protein
MEGTERDTPFLTSALDGVGGQSAVHSGRFTPGNDPVPTVWEAEWYWSKDRSQLDRPCEQWRSTEKSQRGEKYPIKNEMK